MCRGEMVVFWFFSLVFCNAVTHMQLYIECFSVALSGTCYACFVVGETAADDVNRSRGLCCTAE